MADDSTPVTTPQSKAGPTAADVVPVAAPAGGNARYVLDREIARGGMGRVFAGRDLRLQRTVAIKMLHAQDTTLALRFEREVKLAARLQHPGVVPVYDAGFWPSGEPFLVMKLVLGQSLARVIRDADTSADRLALLPHVIAAAEAIAYAHDQGIVHRDLKPSNILVGAFGETVVVDWGLAKDLRAGASTSEPDGDGSSATPVFAGDTAAGAVVGTPSYMPPEQAAGHPVDPRADVYALGAILYYVLAGTSPQAASPAAPGAARGALARPVPLAELEPGLPPDLLAVVAKALSPEAAGRYPSAFELADDLRRFAGGQLVAARDYSPGAHVMRFVARHPLAISIAAALAAGVTVLALR
jgi:eukaryotic-like serine/threonine-protein kinase